MFCLIVLAVLIYIVHLAIEAFAGWSAPKNSRAYREAERCLAAVDKLIQRKRELKLELFPRRFHRPRR